MNTIFKGLILGAISVFMLMAPAGPAMAHSTPGAYEVVFWWDVDDDLIPDTNVTLDTNDVLSADLYVSGINSEYAWSSFSAEIEWDDTLFNSPTIAVDTVTWAGPAAPGSPSVGPPFFANHGAAPGVFVAGDDIKLLDITLDFTGTPSDVTILATSGDGKTSLMDWSQHVAANWPEGASFVV
jgi:hypothetical protein